jgi:hypothetical protein
MIVPMELKFPSLRSCSFTPSLLAMPKGLSNGVQIKYGTSIRRDSKPITRKLNKTGKQLAKKRATENSQIACAPK